MCNCALAVTFIEPFRKNGKMIDAKCVMINVPCLLSAVRCPLLSASSLVSSCHGTQKLKVGRHGHGLLSSYFHDFFFFFRRYQGWLHKYGLKVTEANEC